jgi:hypothetical protein
MRSQHRVIVTVIVKCGTRDKSYLGANVDKGGRSHHKGTATGSTSRFSSRIGDTGTGRTDEKTELPLIELTFQHGQSLDEASRRLETAVDQASRQFQALVRRVEWTGDRKRVKLEGIGFWVEMWVDAETVHATGDIPTLGGLLSGSLGAGLKQILQQTFQKKLP